MKKLADNNNRRDFLIKCGLSTSALMLPTSGIQSMSVAEMKHNTSRETKAPVNFIYDGLAYTPEQYLHKLNEVNQKNTIEPDFYGNGGATKLLEDKFAKLTGKEKAIYLPTGTMANQLAIKLLNGNNTKVIVP